jgi:hypothetical protein
MLAKKWSNSCLGRTYGPLLCVYWFQIMTNIISSSLQYNGIRSMVPELLIMFLTSSTRFQDSDTMDNCSSVSSDHSIGVSTGNWGCGAFGGNPEIKSMIQWIAVSQVQDTCYCTVKFQGYQYWWTISVPNQKSVLISSTINTIGVIICICLFLTLQAHRPFVNYYTFKDVSLKRLEEVPPRLLNYFHIFACI